MLSNAVMCADFTDNFTEEFSNFNDNFNENKEEQPNSIKNEIKKSKKTKQEKDKKEKNAFEGSVTQIDIKSDTLEYYPERQEIEAVGHASIVIPTDGSTLRAEKLILNQETGILKGFGDVRLIKDSNVMEGDFISINLKENNALLTNPITENVFIKLKAENAQLISGKDILLENGVAVAKEDKTILVGTQSFSNYGTTKLADAKKVFYLKEKYDEKYTIKAKEITVDAKAEHDTVTISNADIYLKDIKVGSSGKLKLITNKEQQYVETNMPEIGFIRQMGVYAGPGLAMEAPFGGALKLVPFFSYYENKAGVGGMARYRNDKNVTEFAISSIDEAKTILRGRQDITDTLSVQYGMNGYMDEWFLGDRVSGKLLEAVYRKDYVVEDIGMNFAHRFSGGIAQDFNSHWSTMRFRWMGQADKPIWYYGDDVNNRYAVFELSTQGSAALYGNGDTLALLRFGPRLRTETDRWIQTLGYFYTAKHGETPFDFDRYRYGTNNFYLSEGLKINKYLSVMWSGSFAMNRDAWDDKLMQENRFYVMVGPEDIKFTLGYDTVRERTLFNCFMLLGTKNTDMHFKKLYIKNPDKLGVSKKETAKAERAQLEAKAEIKPSFTDKLFRRTNTKVPEIEPEREEKLIIDESEIYPVSNKVPEHEIIVPQIKEKSDVPAVRSINPERRNTGIFRLHDENTTPMLSPMIAPVQPMQGY